jgi:hypothetical protein
MPLNVGNYWVYKLHRWGYAGSVWWDETYKIKTSVIQSIVKENRIYYKTQNFWNYFDDYLLRTDNITGSLHRYDSLNSCSYYYKEKMLDSLSAFVGDSTKNCSNYFFKCTGIDIINIFGQNRQRKKFSYFSSYMNYSSSSDKWYTMDIGITGYNISGNGYQYYESNSYLLVGCKINGIIYGDTSTSINKVTTSIPEKFSLFQNYPNPFNPNTKIKFEIPNNAVIARSGATWQSLTVSLKVFDILGKEITTLVNEQLQPGTYEITFDGSYLPSGIYFYQLVAGNYIEAKKMILIK